MSSLDQSGRHKFKIEGGAGSFPKSSAIELAFPLHVFAEARNLSEICACHAVAALRKLNHFCGRLMVGVIPDITGPNAVLLRILRNMTIKISIHLERLSRLRRS
jgi:hypothetical protein